MQLMQTVSSGEPCVGVGWGVVTITPADVCLCKTHGIMGSTPGAGIVCTCIGFSPLPSQCVSYTAEFIIICTGYNKQSSMLHCLQSWCVSSLPPPPPPPTPVAVSRSADWLLWSGSHCLTWLISESHASPHWLIINSLLTCGKCVGSVYESGKKHPGSMWFILLTL